MDAWPCERILCVEFTGCAGSDLVFGFCSPTEAVSAADCGLPSQFRELVLVRDRFDVFGQIARNLPKRVSRNAKIVFRARSEASA